MCKTCLTHGLGGKWYLNAEYYSNEIVEKYNLRDFLLEQYKNFEQMSVRKVNGFNCSCANPECAGIRPRLDFNIRSIYKSEYLVDVHHDNCKGCRKCIARCPFDALAYNYTLKRTVVDYDKCFGCGVCMHACGNEGLYLRPRSEIPAYANDY